jgi:hypothetical protein
LSRKMVIMRSLGASVRTCELTLGGVFYSSQQELPQGKESVATMERASDHVAWHPPPRMLCLPLCQPSPKCHGTLTSHTQSDSPLHAQILSGEVHLTGELRVMVLRTWREAKH